MAVVSVCALVCGFFLQAEDGIRDLVRSRGLGDVYKRQPVGSSCAIVPCNAQSMSPKGSAASIARLGRRSCPVSYTHLTLPTSDLV